MRGPIPDKPPTRPTVPEVLGLARAYYLKPGNEAGGHLHIVLDDRNLADEDVRFCATEAERAGDLDGWALARKIELLTGTQRRKLYSDLRQVVRGLEFDPGAP